MQVLLSELMWVPKRVSASRSDTMMVAVLATP
jgi:hypothetical protein